MQRSQCFCQASRLSIAPPSALRRYFLRLSSTAAEFAHSETFPDQELKRRVKVAQKGSKKLAFVDEIVVKIQAGAGGDGCVAFHREKFEAYGGPSGGNGGIGSSVYIVPDKSLQSLASVNRIIKGQRGHNGKGTWMHGLRAPDVIIKVPYGTILEELESHEHDIPLDETGEERRQRLFVYYPGHEDGHAMGANLERTEAALVYEERRARRYPRIPLRADLSTEVPPILVARGGLGGQGNSVFATNEHRLPRFATRGKPGEQVTLRLELKTIADVGLVGMPNRGKSSLLQALSRSRTRVADYAFTTLAPEIGVVILHQNGSLKSQLEKDQEEGNNRLASSDDVDREENIRFTIADCPGLLPDAAYNGLGSSFLRHIERSRILVYVVDISTPNPVMELDILKRELEAYQPGLSDRAKLVIANKADCLSPKTDNVQERLEAMQQWMGDPEAVVLCSAKKRGNLGKVADKLRALLIQDAAI